MLNSRFVIMRNVSDVIILNRRVLSQMRSRCFASPLRVRLRPPCHYERNEVESKRFSAAEGVISGRTALRMTFEGMCGRLLTPSVTVEPRHLPHKEGFRLPRHHRCLARTVEKRFIYIRKSTAEAVLFLIVSC